MTETAYPAPDWVRDAVFYEIFPERFANGDPANDPPGVVPWGSPPSRTNFFGGDLQGIIDKLDYLEWLGVTALYLTPIFAAQTNHKYDTVDYYQIDPHFGDLATFRRLLRAAHERGIRIVLDAVFNHVGDGFWAFRDVVERGVESPYINWFYIEDLPVTKRPSPNYGTFENADYLVRLNVHNPEVRQYLYDVGRRWTEEGIDGWRLDVPYLMNHRFWKGFRRAVKPLNPELYIVGEIWERATDWLLGDEFDGAMNYRLRDVVLDFLVYERSDAAAFDRALASVRSEHPGESPYNMLNLLGSHDTPRLLTLCQGDKARVKLASAFLLTYLGAPMIYYGDEVGMAGENDPDCRRGMIWDPAGQDRELLDWHRRLISIRRTQTALRRGSFRSWCAAGHLFAFERAADRESVLVALNRGPVASTLELPDDCWRGLSCLQDQLSGRTYTRGEPVQIEARSVLVLTGASESPEPRASVTQ